MFILENLIDWSQVWGEVWGILRRLFFLIDSIGLTFIDNAYNLMISAMSAFDGEKVAEIAKDIAGNCYIIIGLFALFRIALILVNSMIDPDKLTDKKEGAGNILIRLVITLVLFVMVPFIFEMSRDLQAQIVDKNYISKLIVGKDLSADSNGNPGKTMKEMAVKSLIYPDETFYKDSKLTTYCDQESDVNEAFCIAAVNNWKNDPSYKTINRHLPEFQKINEENVYYYNYTPFITLLVGGFITYVLFSFAIDIAIRSVELVVLEVLAPLFLVTYIDPKSSTSGPFKKWLTACGKTYLSLFIKIAVISLMLLFITKLNDIFALTSASEGMLQLLIYIAILIFAKRAPKWLGDMLGIDGSSLGGLGIGNKLGEMAGIGGITKKGIDSAKGFATQKGKNFAGNRARNTLARIGGMREAIATNKARKKAAGGKDYQKESVWKQGRAAAKQSKADNYGKDVKGMADITAGYMAGRKNLNPQAKTTSEKRYEKYQIKNAAYQDSVGNTDAKRAEAMDFAKKKAVALNLYTGDGKVQMDPKGNGDRLKVTNKDGKTVYLNPQGAKEMNEAFGHPTTEVEAFTEFGRNLATNQGLTIRGDNVVMKDGSVRNLAEYGAENMTHAGRLAVANVVAENVEKTVSNYHNSRENMEAARQQQSAVVAQRNQAYQGYNADPRVVAAKEVIERTDELSTAQAFITATQADPSKMSKISAAQATIAKIEGNPDYQNLLKIRNSGGLVPPAKHMAEIKRLEEYEHQINIHKPIIKEYVEAQEIVSKHAEAVSTIDNVKVEYNLEVFDERVAAADAVVKQWESEVKGYKDEFIAAAGRAPSFEIDIKTGKVITDEHGRPKAPSSKPYEVDIIGPDGKKKSVSVYSEDEHGEVKDNYVKIDEIMPALATKTSKTKKAYDEEIDRLKPKSE